MFLVSTRQRPNGEEQEKYNNRDIRAMTHQLRLGVYPIFQVPSYGDIRTQALPVRRTHTIRPMDTSQLACKRATPAQALSNSESVAVVCTHHGFVHVGLRVAHEALFNLHIQLDSHDQKRYAPLRLAKMNCRCDSEWVQVYFFSLDDSESESELTRLSEVSGPSERLSLFVSDVQV